MTSRWMRSSQNFCPELLMGLEGCRRKTKTGSWWAEVGYLILLTGKVFTQCCIL